MNGFPKQTSNALENMLKQHFGASIHLQALEPVGGGCINQTCKATLADGSVWFIKLSQAGRLDMFVAESDGLHAIRATNTLYAPEPVGYGTAENSACLILEYLDLRGRSQSRLAGEQLAAMHRHTAERFGWLRDNTIGSTMQRNRQHDDWVEFWRQERLVFQLRLARHNAYPTRAYEQGMQLAAKLDAFFTDYQPQASLLHGDLWGGNMAFAQDGRPVIFDPAVYYGDREADLAMTELFGGFDAEFYAAYNSAWPLDAGYKVRKTLYNLYHILNHFNLFGGGYGMQAARMTESLLAQV
ncbi:MAG: fructosamine kinase family protein [Gammaproteobacteria bacterium]|nr:fructosamine kinase family protein [Gammaproteobacteria bacterium]MBU1725463.1 fructosamine kinase family protein [Gammaproteobacteria bacterium]MBU2005800.1 fructosamine kinase family protein [Gammaproteobacteria bacterium]